MSADPWGTDRPINERQPARGWDVITTPFLLPDYMKWTMTKDKFGNVTYHAPPTEKGFRGSAGAGAESGAPAAGPTGGEAIPTATTTTETLAPIAQGTDVAGLGLSPEALGLTGAGATGSLTITGAGGLGSALTSGWNKLLSATGGYKGLFQLLAKGWTLYELYDALNSGDEKKPPTSGGGGKKGGGGGGGKGSYTGAGGVGSYGGLNYQPQFLAWQPTNAGAPQFTSGGPSSLGGRAAPPPPPISKKKKKKGGG